MVVELLKKELITEDLLCLTTGMVKGRKATHLEDEGRLRKNGGHSAKFLKNTNTGYIYPLIKTHKLNKNDLLQTASLIFQSDLYML